MPQPEPLEILPPVAGLSAHWIEFQRGAANCPHVPHCPYCIVDAANRPQLESALRAVEGNPREGAHARFGQTILYEDDLRLLLRTIDERTTP